MNRYILPIISAAALFAFDASADWISVTGEYGFGPDKSQSEACEEAERRAKEKALESVTGERISSEDNLVCSEMKDDAECSLNRFTWSTIDGLIKEVRIKKTETVAWLGDFRKCQVSMDVDVGVGTGKPDPNFDIQVRLNHKSFRHGESLRISLSPSQPMYVSVFQYLPYMKSEKQVTRIFPNTFDKQHFFKKKGDIPTKKGSQQYDMTVGFPEEQNIANDQIDEYLMVIGTRKPISFLDTYSRYEFQSRLLEIPRQNRRTVKKAYNVLRPEQ